MATVGLRDLFYAKITEVETEGVVKSTYDTPKRMAKAINADLTVEVAEGTLYADDAADEVEREFVGGTLTLGLNDLSDEVAADLLGHTLAEDGTLYAGADDTAPYVAVGFRARKPGGKFKYMWLYKVKFGVPSENYATKGESITFNTPSIVGDIMRRPDDGNWKAQHTGLPSESVPSAWFTKVKEPTAGI